MKNDCRPVGFFDSGVGGISVLKAAYKLMPEENYIYYGDSGNAPYGNKPEETIKKLSLSAGQFLFDKGVKAIVMACNTATSAAVFIMREKFNIPVISMEPAVKPALAASKGGRVLVLATPATVSQPRYLGLLARIDAGDNVISVGCPGLAQIIEDGRDDEDNIHAYLSSAIGHLRSETIDSVVLGCTHYAFAEEHIRSFMDRNFSRECSIFDGRFGTARHLRNVITENGLCCDKNNTGRIEFLTSGQADDAHKYKTLFEKIK